MLLSDGIMCGLTGVSWIIQKLVFQGYISWDKSGWIVQNVKNLGTCKVSYLSLTPSRSGRRPLLLAS